VHFVIEALRENRLGEGKAARDHWYLPQAIYAQTAGIPIMWQRRRLHPLFCPTLKIMRFRVWRGVQGADGKCTKVTRELRRILIVTVSNHIFKIHLRGIENTVGIDEAHLAQFPFRKSRQK
jgi:hypothetical protein